MSAQCHVGIQCPEQTTFQGADGVESPSPGPAIGWGTLSTSQLSHLAYHGVHCCGKKQGQSMPFLSTLAKNSPLSENIKKWQEKLLLKG